MMLTLHGLPSAFNYHELKMMIKHESSLNDFILDNLVTEGDGTKKVRIGVADESEGSHLIKCLDGFRLRGNILRVVPVAKAPINPQQGNFNQRPGFPPRNDIQRQPGNYGSQPPGPMGARPSPWAPNSNQWTPNQGPGQQIPQNNFGFQQGSNPPYSQQQQTPPTLQRPDPKSFGQRDIGNRMPPHDQSYGFAQKNVIPNDANRRVEARQLRSVEVVPGAAPHARAPLAHAAQPPRFGDKPLTINKDYFQGSNQFGPTGPGHFQPSPQNQQAPWSQPVQPAQKSPGFKPPQFDEERKFPPTDKRPGLPKEPDVRNLPNTYKEYEKGPYPPQPERRADPPRRMSPGRRGSPGRRIGGRESPRRVSPHKRLSPGRRLVSPPRGPERRESPSRHGMRYSPSRRGDKGDKFPAAPKQVRPAYEPETPNQTSYPGGYRPNLHENVQYPVAGARADRGDSPWRQDRERAKGPFTAARRDDERRPPARADAAPERLDAARDRSPLRARRHSPSPRSPRRSWALEKRRSPPPRDAPPPPVWPGPDQDYPEPDRPAWTPAARRDRYSPKPPRVSRFEPATKFEPRNPEFEPRDPKFEPREPKFEARDPKFEARDPKFEARDPKFELRDPKFEPRDSKFGPRDPKYGSRDPKFGSRDPKFESRDPKFEVRDTKFEVRDPKFEARDSKFDSRDHKFDSRDPKFEPRDPKFDHRDAKYESRDSKFDLRENKFDSRGPRFDPRDVKFEPRDSKFDMRGPKFEPRDTKFDSRDPKFEPRDHPKFEPRDHPKFEPRDHPKFESRIHPKFEPRDSKFDRRDTKFESRDPKFEHRDPKFEPRDMKFDQRDTKFDSREPKFERRDPKFEPRDPKFDPRDLEGPSDRRDFRRADDGPDRRGYPDREDFRNFHDYDRQRDDFRREDFRREERKDDRRGPEVFDKEFDDIYKRAMEFKQKVQELRRTGGRSRDREEFTDERHRPDDRRKFHDDRRDEDTRQDYRRDMDRREDRPRIRDEDFGRQRDPEWRIEESKPKPLDSAAKVKREKAAEEIAEKILLKHATFSMNEDIKARVIKEMKYMVLEIINDMFGRDDVSFIETVIKFRAAHNDRDEYKIFQKVMGSLPDHQKSGKRPGEESSETPAKTSRRSPENLNQGPRLVTAPRPSPKAGVPTVRRPVAKPEMKRPMHKDGPVKKPAGEPGEPGAPEPRAGGARQLDALTARVLEDELQQVMIEVWQLLPDDPPCNVEKMLVDKLRNEAGDQIRDILGLNVTKRLLNTFNPLNVKVHFTTKPERKYLRQFLKDYNFVAFKRIARVDNTFAAQVRTVADYDRLCARRDIHCGAAKITITPYYRFRQCPKNLKTIYSNVDEDKDTENTEALEKDNMEECDDPNEANSNDITSASDGAKQTVEDTSQAKTVTTVTKSVATSTADEESTTKLNNSSTNKDSNSTTAKDIDSSTTKVNESSSGNETKTSPNQIVEVKPQPKEAPKLQVENKSQQTLSRATTDSTKPETTVSTAVELQPKTVPAPQDTAVTAKPGKVEPAQTQVEKKATPTKAQPKLEPVKPKIENKTENTKPIIENKTETAKPKVGNKTENAKPLAKVEPVKAQVAAIKPKPKQLPKTTNAVPKSKNVVKPPNRNSIINAKNNRKSADVVKGKQITKNKAKVKKSFEEKDDFEELDDEDILALMSGGIVLDECSGSDEE